MSEVRLTKARTFELDPNKVYLIEAEKWAISQDDLRRVAKELHTMGVKNIIVSLPKDQHLKITEVTKET